MYICNAWCRGTCKFARNVDGTLWSSCCEQKESGCGRRKKWKRDGASYCIALAESYLNAQHWSTRRQILFLMTDKLSLKEMREFIPTVTSYRYNIARYHRLLHRRAAPLPNQEKKSMRIKPIKLKHFLSFITSPHVIQDVPFGEKPLRLSSGEIIKTPNVIRKMIQQQQQQQ